MIRKPDNWESVPAEVRRRKLPVGGYVCLIRDVSTSHSDFGDRLNISFDISEGDYAAFYTDEYNRNPSADKKYKGVFRLWLPSNDGSEKDERTKSRFKAFISAVEESNRGYKWNWDEQLLVNKEIGIVFRNEEYDFNGRNGFATKPCYACSSDKIRIGEYSIPNAKLLPKDHTYTSSGMTQIEDVDGEIPF